MNNQRNERDQSKNDYQNEGKTNETVSCESDNSNKSGKSQQEILIETLVQQSKVLM